MARRKRNYDTSDEAHELYLYATNTSELYNQFKSITLNLAKKKAKGVYDHSKAIKLWTYWMDAAAKRYTREFDVPGAGRGGSYGIFTAAIRREAAKEIADFWEGEWSLGNYDRMVPAKYASKRNPEGNIYLSKAAALKAGRSVQRQGRTVKVWKRWAGNHEEYWITSSKSSRKNPGKAKRAERLRKGTHWTGMGLPSLKRTRTMAQYLYRARSSAARGGSTKAPIYRGRNPKTDSYTITTGFGVGHDIPGTKTRKQAVDYALDMSDRNMGMTLYLHDSSGKIVGKFKDGRRKRKNPSRYRRAA